MRLPHATMTIQDIHDDEVKALIWSTFEESITGNHLRIRFRKDITAANMTHGTVSQRRALRDWLLDHNVTCGLDTGESI